MKLYEVKLVENNKQITITVFGRSKKAVKNLVENKNRKVITVREA